MEASASVQTHSIKVINSVATHKIIAPRSVIATALLVLDNGKPPNYIDYPMFGNLLDSEYIHNVTLLASRQVGKTVYVASRAIMRSLQPYHKFVYVAPSMKQVNEFSRLKLGLMVSRSELLHHLLLSKDSPLVPPGELVGIGTLVNDVHLKVFANASSINLSYASDEKGVDRLRGKTADEVTIDEAQNTDLSALMPVILPMLRASDFPIMNTYGTPLTEHDSLMQRFAVSTQHTKVVKCEACNRWNTLDNFRVIGKTGLICAHCGRAIDARNGKFIPMNPGSTHLGVHINRLMLADTTSSPIKWRQLINDIEDPNTTEDKAVREILGRASGTSLQMITKEDVGKIATGNKAYAGRSLRDVLSLSAKERKDKNKQPYVYLYAVDWGGGALSIGNSKDDSKSRTASVLMGAQFDHGHLRLDLLYYKLFPLAHPINALKEVKEDLAILPHGSYTGCDALGGTFAISEIRSYLAEIRCPNPFLPIQLGTISPLTPFLENDDRITVDKTRVMNKFFLSVIHQHLSIPASGLAIKELSDQFLAEVEIITHEGKRIWRKKSGLNDDVLLAAVFAHVLSAYFIDKFAI